MAERGHLWRFVIVGSAGFVIDAGAFTLGLAAGLEPHGARAVAFLIAVGCTYAGNRAWTFSDAGKASPTAYLGIQTIGMALNMLVFSLVILRPTFPPLQYYLGLAAGSLSGLAVTYVLSKKHVFLRDN